jgi:hypothetical protein
MAMALLSMASNVCYLASAYPNTSKQGGFFA